jgi:Putative zinc-finger
MHEITALKICLKQEVKVMNCKDFREIADSYLSNELLVETNHEVLQHLENCANCRRELGARRELRDALRVAVKNSPDNQINPIFAKKLTNNLRESAFGKQKNWNFIGAKMILASVFAALILTIAFGLIWQKPATQTANLNPNEADKTNINLSNKSLKGEQAMFAEARKDAVDDHRYCALKFSLKELPISLEEAAEKYGRVNKNLDEAVIKPMREVFGGKAKFHEAHSCIINGRRFAHVVIEYQGKIISVLLTKREDDSEKSDSDAISCQSAENLRVACFESGKYSVFVVSDLPESENLLVARTISPSVKKHITRNEIGV